MSAASFQISFSTAEEVLWNSPSIAYSCNIKILWPLLLYNQITHQGHFFPNCKCTYISNLIMNFNLEKQWTAPRALTFTCVLGKADVRSVSWVSSAGFLRGTLNTNAAWSQVAAAEVMRYPLSHRLCIPSLGYRKSSSTTYKHQYLWSSLDSIKQSTLNKSYGNLATLIPAHPHGK
jgi:hypothetical protein